MSLTDARKVSRQAGAQRWQFSIKGESLNISSLKLPETAPVKTPKDLEGVVMERVYLVEKVIGLVVNLFAHFVKLRISNEWRNQTVPRIQKWAAAS